MAYDPSPAVFINAARAEAVADLVRRQSGITKARIRLHRERGEIKGYTVQAVAKGAVSTLTNGAFEAMQGAAA